VGAAALGASLLSGLGRWDWRCELACHFRAHYAWTLAGCAAVLAASSQFGGMGVAALGAAANACAVAPLYRRPGPRARGRPLRVALANVLRENRSFDRVIQFVRAQQPDVLFLQETTEAWVVGLRALRDEYPYGSAVPRRDGFGMMLLSRVPVDRVDVVRIGPIAVPSIVASIRTEPPVTVIGTHPFAPIGRERAWLRRQQLGALGDYAAGARRPVIVLADLNSTSWSPVFRDLLIRGRLRDSRVGFGIQPSWPCALPAWLRIPIDHCLVSEELAVRGRQVGPDLGSDHRPIVVDVELPG
jgi:endonuclease/exonuclease/phosphatase (EEP) superfamily protein YafD